MSSGVHLHYLMQVVCERSRTFLGICFPRAAPMKFNKPNTNFTEQREKESFPTGRPVLFFLRCKMKVIRLKITPIFLPSRWLDDRVLERKQAP
jgi:hypothetical protein